MKRAYITWITALVAIAPIGASAKNSPSYDADAVRADCAAAKDPVDYSQRRKTAFDDFTAIAAKASASGPPILSGAVTGCGDQYGHDWNAAAICAARLVCGGRSSVDVSRSR